MPDIVPERPGVAALYRRPLEALERHLPLPPIPPTAWTLGSLAFSASVLFVGAWWQQAALVAAALAADWLDGATARRLGTGGMGGYVTDVVLDRVGEGLIFLAGWHTAVGRLFLAAWVLNVALTAYSLRTGRHRVLPLRFAYLVALVAWPLWPPGWRPTT